MEFATTAADTDVAVKLIDQYPPSLDYPDGFAMNLCDTVIRLRCVDGIQPVDSIDGRNVFRLKVELPPIANRFMEGHNIRLDISSSNFPRIDANHNVLGGGPRTHQATITINGVRVGGQQGTTLALPVMADEHLTPLGVPAPYSGAL